MKYLLVLSFMLCLAAESYSQPQLTWTSTRICDSCLPGAFQFLSAQVGAFTVLDKTINRKRLYSTSDGGQRWELRGTDTRYSSLNVYQSRNMDYFPSGSFFDYGINSTNVGFNGFSEWEIRPITQFRGVFSVQQMFTPAFGYRLQEIGLYKGIWDLLVTYDSARTWSVKSELIPPQIEGKFGYFTGFVEDAIYFDSLNILMAFNLSTDSIHHYGGIYKTTDAGEHWTYKVPFGIDDQYFRYLIPGSRQGRYYVLGGFRLNRAGWYWTDFVWTDDDGETWRADSTTAHRIARLANTGGDTLWALVGRFRGVPNDFTGYGTYVSLADSIFFSSNNGRTWYRDGDTFANDTLVGMFWPSADTCFIPMWKDGGVTMYRGILNGSNSVAAGEQSAAFHVIPNPATESITLSAPRGVVKLFDVIGRKLAEIDYDGRPIDVRSLPAGIYSVEFASHGQTEWAKFLKQ